MRHGVAGLLNGEVVGVVRHPTFDDEVNRAGVPDVGEGVVVQQQ
jgi:hypothetical protein